MQTAYYSLIQVFKAMYNFQTKAPDFGTCQSFSSPQKCSRIWGGARQLFCSLLGHKTTLKQRGGSTVLVKNTHDISHEGAGGCEEGNCCFFTPTGVNTLNLVANALLFLGYIQGSDCTIQGEDGAYIVPVLPVLCWVSEAG